MTTPKRVQMSRQHPWRADNPDAVIVARPGPYGNPFRVVRRNGEWIVLDDNGVDYPVWEPRSRLSAVRHAVALYELDVTVWHSAGITEEDIRRDLAGRDVACWCGLDQPCHGDPILRVANGEAT